MKKILIYMIYIYIYKMKIIILLYIKKYNLIFIDKRYENKNIK